MKRCLQQTSAPPRQKSCFQCSNAKVRCDLSRPSCGRCQLRSVACKFVSDDHDQALHKPAPSPVREQHQEPWPLPGTSLEMLEKRRRLLLADTPTCLNFSKMVLHNMHYNINVMKSWARIMAEYNTAQLPPFIHRSQLLHGVPAPLVRCCALLESWQALVNGNRKFVHIDILQEVRRLLREVRKSSQFNLVRTDRSGVKHVSYDENDLLATAQSLLLLMSVLFFDTSNASVVAHPIDAQIVIDVWEVKRRLAETGLFVAESSDHYHPLWHQWAMANAKQRTFMALTHLELAWSIYHGYPPFPCHALGPLPAPAPGFLWREAEEWRWEQLYDEWRRKWPDGGYTMAECITLDAIGTLDARTELWLAEADEFGMVLITGSESSYKSTRSEECLY